MTEAEAYLVLGVVWMGLAVVHAALAGATGDPAQWLWTGAYLLFGVSYIIGWRKTRAHAP